MKPFLRSTRRKKNQFLRPPFWPKILKRGGGSIGPMKSLQNLGKKAFWRNFASLFFDTLRRTCFFRCQKWTLNPNSGEGGAESALKNAWKWQVSPFLHEEISESERYLRPFEQTWSRRTFWGSTRVPNSLGHLELSGGSWHNLFARTGILHNQFGWKLSLINPTRNHPHPCEPTLKLSGPSTI